MTEMLPTLSMTEMLPTLPITEISFELFNPLPDDKF